MPNDILMALAGQPNAGKSTVFNLLTGAHQHVANYPGVTVEKKVGRFKLNGDGVELVDLPGTYSMTSYSMEERVARDFLLSEKPAVVVGVADASNLKRHLHLAFQLMEMERPMVLALNMMDVAQARGQRIDAGLLASKLGVAVAPMVGRKGRGKDELLAAVANAASGVADSPLRLDYGALEQPIFMLEKTLDQAPDPGAPARWLAIKLLEGDEVVRETIGTWDERGGEILALADELAESFRKAAGESPDRAIERRRFETAEALVRECVHAPDEGGPTRSDKADRLICHRLLGYPILFGVLYLMYYLSIELGYELTNYTWPALAWGRDALAGVLPAEGFVTDPTLRSLVLWLADSVNALLNYIPIFLILFVYIALLEDLGYMPRMAFLLDAFFRRYGLHGQSTLPLVLGGVYVGGCAVPGVMACRAVPDERARLATILVTPMMNCLAKVPLYILLIGVYFAAYKGQAMFFIATITILMALTTAKLLNLSVLRSKETAPFIMEMPPYHAPTVRGVLRRGLERVWVYVKKIITVVAAVSVILFALMQFPGLSDEEEASLEARKQTALEQFFTAAKKSEFWPAVDTPGKVKALLAFAADYKNARRGVGSRAEAEALAARFKAKNPEFYTILKDRRNRQAKIVNRAYKRLRRIRMGLRREAKNTIINNSFLGRLGKWMEPVTQYAGFTWRVNVSLLSALAAKENTVATLGALYQDDGDGDTASAMGQSGSLEQRMAQQEAGFTPLHALALMLFMALYPPCMATTMVVKVQSGSWKWMLFSLAYMTGLGALVAVLVFSGGSLLGLTGLEAMAWFYGLAVAATVATGLIKPRTTDL
jgi:ferrous iron transport protein B